ncbi:hypothetical protein C8R43DRAFT_972722 [Mycena crocata]|nr:hypothetical protein C8R43DRAFT_972722 [Mycena crocata]
MNGMGHPSKVTISRQTVVDLSKSAIVPIKCEAQVSQGPDGTGPLVACGVVLNSYKMFYKHQVKKHSSKKRASAGRGATYICRLNKCSAQFHTSPDSFRKHVQQSHMKTVPLPCPFANCKPPIPNFGRAAPYHSFLKEKDLITHLEQAHSEFIDRDLDARSSALRPSWDPRPPARPLRAPPNLPSDPVPTVQFRLDELPPRDIPSGWFNRLQYQGPGPGSGSSTLGPSLPPWELESAPKTPKTPRGLLRESSLRTQSQAPDTDGPSVDGLPLADLPQVEFNRKSKLMEPPGIMAAPYFVIREELPGSREGGERVDLARPLHMREAPVPVQPPPPTSIFHEALRQHSAAADEKVKPEVITPSPAPSPLP